MVVDSGSVFSIIIVFLMTYTDILFLLDEINQYYFAYLEYRCDGTEVPL